MKIDKQPELLLLSKPTFQNTALADYLSRITHRACRVIEHVPPNATHENALLLVDTHDRDPLETLSGLDQLGRLTASSKVGLINVRLDDCPVTLLGFPFLRGIFSAGIDPSQFVRGIEAVMEGEVWLPRRLLQAHLERTRRRAPPRHAALSSLTEKEVEILTRLAGGNSNTNIAEQLNISVHTVKTHIYNLFRKLEVHNRTQATNWANQHLEHLAFQDSARGACSHFH